MTELPTGTVTFLFTDLEGSTRLREQHPEAMRAALARHDEILRDAVDNLTDGRLPEAVHDIRAGFERSVEIRDELTIGAAALSSVAALDRLGSAEAAATILGALDASVLFNYAGSGYGLFHIDEVRGAVAGALPGAEFAAALRRGAAMSYDEAVVFVRESLVALETSVGGRGRHPE